MKLLIHFFFFKNIYIITNWNARLSFVILMELLAKVRRLMIGGDNTENAC